MTEARRLVYWVLIVAAVSAAAGRLLSSQLLFEPSIHKDESDPKDTRRAWPQVRPRPMPTFGSNDRSRWATIRSLVDEGTFVVGRRDRTMIVATAVLPLGQFHPIQASMTARGGYEFRTKKGDSGIIFEDGWQSIDKVLHPTRLEFTSSKPPLLSTLLAGLYWLLKMLFGWTLAQNPGAVVRTILFVVNIIPFGIYLGVIARLVERRGTTDWGRFFVLAAAGFATMMTPFQITLNNHTIATYCVLFAVASVLSIWNQRHMTTRQPGWRSFAGAGLFSAFAACNELPALALAAALFLVLLAHYPGRTMLFFLPPALALAAAFYGANFLAVGQWQVAYGEVNGPWYQYEGSHWRQPNYGEIRPGIDFARFKETKLQYAFHVLFGHHGWFSLTPIWILALAGIVLGCRRRGDTDNGYPWFLAPMVLGISLVVIVFYVVLRNEGNYGGWTLGPRWLMWLTPMWLLFLLPIADRLAASRIGRFMALGCLAVSIASNHYSTWNPWRHPWIYDLMIACGWPGY